MASLMLPPQPDLKRCAGRSSSDPAAPKCPRRLECERYVLWVSREVGETVPWDAHLCTTEQYEHRIAPVYGD